MFKKRKLKNRIKKAIAIFLISVIVSQIAIPTVAFALTSGPTAPEATSFEPIDTTDMVNPLTGDFTYNMPLLEVPGPEGGYPLSLSYHAGIQPDEDASWVGLGWSLNPGAITRSVNGFPDDWIGTNVSKRDYWDGGVRKTFRVGATFGLAGPVGNVSFGLDFSQDSFKGFGVGAWVGLGVYPKDSELGFRGTFGFSPYGEGFYAGLGVQMPDKIDDNISESLSLSARTNFNTVGFSAEGGLHSFLGATISTEGGSPSFSIGGIQGSVYNGNAGRTTTEHSEVNISIPVTLGVNISFGVSKTRYWSDETASTTILGSLNSVVGNAPDDVGYDNYTLPDPSSKITDKKDPGKTQGGALPDNDIYSVVAQGLNGNIRPHNFQTQTLAQNLIRKDPGGNVNKDTTLIKYFSTKSVPSVSPQAKFRFVNDFSNRYRQTEPSYSSANVNLKTTSPTFDANPQYGDGTISGYEATNDLRGSKTIEYFTLNNGTIVGNGFIVPTVSGAIRSKAKNNHIVGFKIKNSSGVTYHYNLPAYAYAEEITQERKSSATPGATEPYTYNRQIRSEGYAYTWFLTSITGPDYVDRNGNSKVDAADWGYWVNFEYGKWSGSEDFAWRNPSEGLKVDEDNNFTLVSMGKKELFYLNAIRTRTHVAIFEKAQRIDGRGASPFIFDKDPNWWDSYNLRNGGFDANSQTTLRLNKIYLLNASDANIISPSSANVTAEFNQVIDTMDVDQIGRSTLEGKAIRIVDFKYSYGLAKGTTNSFTLSSPGSNGKLCLNSVSFRGRSGAILLPPVEFEYDISSEDLISASNCSLNRGYFQSSNGNFEIGDLVETFESSPIFCGVITKKEIVGGQYRYTLKNNQYTSTSSSTKIIKQTKNPPYDKNARDMWGMYKSDYSPHKVENLARLATETSNAAADVWSLRKVKTSLGSEICVYYEGNTYGESVLSENQSLAGSTFTKIDATTWRIDINNSGFDMTQLFKTNDTLSAGIFFRGKLTSSGSFVNHSFNTQISGYQNTIKVNSVVDSNTLEIKATGAVASVMNSYSTSSAILAANFKPYSSKTNFGGGIRVKSLKIMDLGNNQYITSYNYVNPVNSKSSGVIPYEPTTINYEATPDITDTVYKSFLHSKTQVLYGISREVPATGVMYEYVTVSNSVLNPGEDNPVTIPGKTRYQYEVFRNNMVGRIEVSPEQTGSYGGKTQHIKRWVIKKFNAALGALKLITRYDVNGKRLSEVKYRYLHDGLEGLTLTEFMTQYEGRLSQFQYQGVIKERFSEAKEIKEDNGTFGVRATFLGRDEYPAIPLGKVSTDYVTGIRTSNETVGFDFYSGQATKVLTEDPYGNRFLRIDVPAYRQLEYSIMGSKAINMLTQATSTTEYLMSASNDTLSLVNATVLTWSNNIPVEDSVGNPTTTGQLNIWRPKASFAWMKAGNTANNLTPYSSFQRFKYNGTNVVDWKMVEQITKYNMHSASLESKDMDSIYSSQRMGYRDSKVVVASTLAKNREIAYCSAEDAPVITGIMSTGIQLVDGVVSTTMAHTGTKSISLGANKNGIKYTVNLSDLDRVKRDYQIMVWVRSTGTEYQQAKLYYKIGSGSTKTINPTFLKSAGGWYLLEGRIPSTDFPATFGSDQLSLWCGNSGSSGTVYFDDFRFQPVNAPTTSYVYDSFTGLLTYIIDNNNLYVRFGYDPAGRLMWINKEVLGKSSAARIKEITYRFAKPLSN